MLELSRPYIILLLTLLYIGHGNIERTTAASRVTVDAPGWACRPNRKVETLARGEHVRRIQSASRVTLCPTKCD